MSKITIWRHSTSRVQSSVLSTPLPQTRVSVHADVHTRMRTHGHAYMAHAHTYSVSCGPPENSNRKLLHRWKGGGAGGLRSQTLKLAVLEVGGGGGDVVKGWGGERVVT